MFRPTISRIATPAGISRAFSSTGARPVARINIVGNLTAAPELQATSTGHDLIRYVVASNSGPRDNRQASYFRVTAFEADSARRNFLLGLPKGSLVYVEGDASMSKFEDAEGKVRTSLNIVQRHLESLKRGQDAEAEVAAGAQ